MGEKYAPLHLCSLILSQREADVEAPYYPLDELDTDGSDYCWDCIRELHPEWVYGQQFTGGQGYHESDSAKRCENCGKLLTYTLTDYGIREELGYFEETSFDWSSPTQCFEMARIVNGLFEDEQRDAALKLLLCGRNLPTELHAYQQQIGGAE